MDTVGFVRRLPTQLVEAFKSTLEEIGESDVMVHVVDASHPDPFGQIDAVNEVLKTIDGVDRLPVVTVFNKVDLIDAVTRERLEQLAPGAFFVSSATGEGVDALRAHIEGMLPAPGVHVEALLPYTAGSLVSQIREYGNVDAVEYRDTGILLQADVDERLAAQIMDQALEDPVD